MSKLRQPSNRFVTLSNPSSPSNSPTNKSTQSKTRSKSQESVSKSAEDLSDIDITVGNISDDFTPLRKSPKKNIPPKENITACKLCPCNRNDKRMCSINCSKCQRQWHTSCCNLAGLPATVTKKLEEKGWKCPMCENNPYVSTAEKADYDAKLIQSFESFCTNMSRIEKCSEELNENTTALEFFNQHIRHLLIDDQKFKNHTSKIESLSTDVTTVKELCAMIPEISSQNKELSSCVEKLTQHVESLSSMVKETQTAVVNSPITSQEVCEAIQNLPHPSNDKIEQIQQQIGELVARPNLQDSIPSMEPNTTSPHLHNSSSDPVCTPFVKYDENVLSAEVKLSLQTFLQQRENDFTSIGAEESRDVLYFGDFSYRYAGGSHEAQPMPPEVSRLIEEIKPGLPNPDMAINSCLISRYKSGENHIPAHRDNEPVINPESNIVTVSLGAERTMKFSNNSGSVVVDQKLSDGSMLVASRFSQDFWLHRIDKVESSDVRYSFTFRDVSPHYINSTILLGDSNTQHVKFGSGQGTLGQWMPGKRVKVGHIEEIPDACDIGPYRNVVLHTGVNNLNNPKYRKSNSALIKILESKIQDISTTYPKAKIFISLLLPSRYAPLNYRIRDFNNMILDLTCKFSLVSVIEHSVFGEILSDEHGRWKSNGIDSSDFIPNINDILHLGKHGIRKLAMNFKNSVIKSKKPQSRERFDGGRGGYSRAVERGRGQSGGTLPS